MHERPAAGAAVELRGESPRVAGVGHVELAELHPVAEGALRLLGLPVDDPGDDGPVAGVGERGADGEPEPARPAGHHRCSSIRVAHRRLPEVMLCRATLPTAEPAITAHPIALAFPREVPPGGSLEWAVSSAGRAGDF